ncbi:hypothetical protein IQ06DRAFT_319414 [Phaeosphaeriaceae sp. SRC1lsM3a]|nr:hypothetical protein IQ06DRAFT_319414 [Stagonospora sp. SRC1lsM3a]
MVFSDNRVAAIYWGPKHTTIYNEHMAAIGGDLHPGLMSSSFEEALPELWAVFGPLVRTIEDNQGGSYAQKDLELPILRHGFVEETWWDGGLVSLKDDQGGHGGVYFTWAESTRTVLRDRRTSLINSIIPPSSTSNSLLWQHIHKVFTQFPRDVPMAIIYSVDEEDSQEETLRLEHTIGIPPQYTAAPSTIKMDATTRDAVLKPLIKRAMISSTQFLIIDMAEETLDSSIVENVNWQGFDEPSRHFAIIPLRAGDSSKGFIFMGLNPRCAFDADHEQFITDLARQLRETITRASSEEDHLFRERKLLTALNDTARRVSRFAAIAPVGVYEQGADGTVLWANDHFYDILGVPQEKRDSSFAWKDYIHPEDHNRAEEKMITCMTEAIEISDSLRLNRIYIPPPIGYRSHSTDEPFWIMYSASPDLRPDGSIHSLMGCLADISHLKWTERLHIHDAEVARKDRKRQEEFIDITSHEMRNPLSAITQCADGVMSSLQDAQTTTDAQELKEIIKLNVEAAESILFCAAHQRRIIDDVLTLGKLGSELLTISPSAFRPIILLDQALQMFKTEFDVNMIKAKVVIDDGSTLKTTSTVYGDQSRLMQILVNLLTNAIKFTRTQKERFITIRFGSSYRTPSTDTFGPEFAWHYTGIDRSDLTKDPEYGQGKSIYVFFAVVDSGTGVPRGSVDKVFSKFEQADRRTHTQYGGSGLGLYISRELAEMQGGRIGISSQDGVGSTFAFYTKARMADATSATHPEPTAHSTDPAAQVAIALEAPLQPNVVTVPISLPLRADYNILLVEDNLLNQKVLAKQLAKIGCTVRVSNNGAEAIDAILRMHNEPVEFGTPTSKEEPLSHFDCILMDWEMPVCDGLRATKSIRKMEARLQCKRNVIIGVTANARAEQRAIAMDAGMDTVLPKPFRAAEVLAKIGEFVGSREKETRN